MDDQNTFDRGHFYMLKNSDNPKDILWFKKEIYISLKE